MVEAGFKPEVGWLHISTLASIVEAVICLLKGWEDFLSEMEMAPAPQNPARCSDGSGSRARSGPLQTVCFHVTYEVPSQELMTPQDCPSQGCSWNLAPLCALPLYSRCNTRCLKSVSFQPYSCSQDQLKVFIVKYNLKDALGIRVDRLI